jgi:hypothetical protein
MQVDLNDLPDLINRGARIAFSILNPTDMSFTEWIDFCEDCNPSGKDPFVLLADAAYSIRYIKGLTGEERKAICALSAAGFGLAQFLDAD